MPDGLDRELRVLITGDRHWADIFTIRMVLDGLLARYGDRLVIVEGKAPGADSMAGEWAKANGLTPENGRLREYPAKWGQFGRQGRGDPAGAIRNREMLTKENPHLVVGFHNDLSQSRGTKDMLSVAEKAMKPWILVCSHRPAVVNQTLPV